MYINTNSVKHILKNYPAPIFGMIGLIVAIIGLNIMIEKKSENAKRRDIITRMCIEQHGVRYFNEFDGAVFCFAYVSPRKYYKLELE